MAVGQSSVYFFPEIEVGGGGRPLNPHMAHIVKGVAESMKHRRVTSVSAADVMSSNFWSSLGRADAVFVMWPEGIVDWILRRLSMRISRRAPGNSVKHVAKFAERALDVLGADVRNSRGKLLWFAQETRLHSEDPSAIAVDAQVRRLLASVIDSLVVTEPSTLPPLGTSFPDLLSVPTFTSPIGDYAEDYGHPVNGVWARRALGIDESDVVILMLGAKRGERSTDSFSNQGAAPSRTILTVGEGYGRSRSRDVDIRTFGKLSEASLRVVLGAADYVINPADNYLNSGALRLGLSYGLPAVAYEFGATVDMARDCLVPIGLAGPLEAVRVAPDRRSPEYQRMAETALVRNAERPWSRSVDGVVNALEHAFALP